MLRLTDGEANYWETPKAGRIQVTGEGDENGFKLKGCDGKLDFSLSGLASYSLYADYFWYELGDMVYSCKASSCNRGNV